MMITNKLDNQVNTIFILRDIQNESFPNFIFLSCAPWNAVGMGWGLQTPNSQITPPYWPTKWSLQLLALALPLSCTNELSSVSNDLVDSKRKTASFFMKSLLWDDSWLYPAIGLTYGLAWHSCICQVQPNSRLKPARTLRVLCRQPPPLFQNGKGGVPFSHITKKTLIFCI